MFVRRASQTGIYRNIKSLKNIFSLISRFFSRYLCRYSEKGVPCTDAKAEIIPNEPDVGYATVGNFLSISCIHFKCIVKVSPFFYIIH